MRFRFTFFFYFIATGATFAQDCTCTTSFDFLTEHISVNYSGYGDKTMGQAADSLRLFTQQLRLQTEPLLQKDSACWALCNRWLSWFHDGHLYMRIKQVEGNPNEIRALYAAHERIPVQKNELIAYLKEQSTDTLEGIWAMDEGNYCVALLKKPSANRVYAGIILQADSVYWTPGQVKFEMLAPDSNGAIKARYFMRDHSEKILKATFNANKLNFEEIGQWSRMQADAACTPQKKTNPMPYSIEALDSNTLLFRVPTMGDQYWKSMDSLVKAEKKRLGSMPNWIIDCRNNGGGSDITFKPLLPYLYTNRVKLDRMQILATTDNAEKFTKLKSDKNLPWINRRYYGYLAGKLKRRNGSFVGNSGTFTYRLFKTTSMPQKVVILTNRGCASSCEQFILYAQQSKKVTLMGESTGGVLDFSNLHESPFPCGNWTIWYPTSRSNRVPAGRGLDNVGIPPHVSINQKDADWIQAARQFLGTTH